MPPFRLIREIAIDNIGPTGVTIVTSEEGREIRLHLGLDGDVLRLVEDFEQNLVRIARERLDTDDRFARTAAEPQTGLGIIPAQFGQHVVKIVFINTAHLAQPCQFAAGQQIQIVEQARHAWIITIGLARLQCQAFAQ